MFLYLLWYQGWMKTTHYNGYFSFPKFFGYFIGPSGGKSFHSNSYQVSLIIVRNLLYSIIVKCNLNVGRGQTSNDSQLQGFHSSFINVKGMFHPANIGFY